MRHLSLDRSDQTTDLLAALARTQFQMRPDHPQNLPRTDRDANVECAAWFIVAHREIESRDLAECVSRQDRIAEIRAYALTQKACGDVIAGFAFNLVQKIFVRLGRSNFLQRDN